MLDKNLSNTNKRANFGTSRIELTANYDYITSLINQGFSISSIYRKLSGEKKITISLNAFYYIVNKLVVCKNKYIQNINENININLHSNNIHNKQLNNRSVLNNSIPTDNFHKNLELSKHKSAELAKKIVKSENIEQSSKFDSENEFEDLIDKLV
jgi:hypothetical protein